MSNQNTSQLILRLALSIIIASHGWHRLITGGYEPFGQWLESQGLPLGFALALFITLFEVVGSLILAWGKGLAGLCTIYIAIYFSGLVMVHWPQGWFVVGSGRNGIEYSVLIIAALLSIALPEYQRLWQNYKNSKNNA